MNHETRTDCNARSSLETYHRPTDSILFDDGIADDLRVNSELVADDRMSAVMIAEYLSQFDINTQVTLCGNTVIYRS